MHSEQLGSFPSIDLPYLMLRLHQATPQSGAYQNLVVVINTAAVGTSGATNSDDGDNATSRANDTAASSNFNGGGGVVTM